MLLSKEWLVKRAPKQLRVEVEMRMSNCMLDRKFSATFPEPGVRTAGQEALDYKY